MLKRQLLLPLYIAGIARYVALCVGVVLLLIATYLLARRGVVRARARATQVNADLRPF